MKLIVGLGNPGEKYKNNRHNVGFMMIDYILKSQKSPLRPSGFVGQAKVKSHKDKLSVLYSLSSDLMLAKPQTFMNRSGIAVKQIIKRLKLNVESLIVVHDDLDIPLGKFKIQQGTGPQLHNGIKSIEEALKTKPSFTKASEGEDFWRVRIGVDNRILTNRINGETYVLNNFLQEEKKILLEVVFPKISARLTLTSEVRGRA